MKAGMSRGSIPAVVSQSLQKSSLEDPLLPNHPRHWQGQQYDSTADLGSLPCSSDWGWGMMETALVKRHVTWSGVARHEPSCTSGLDACLVARIQCRCQCGKDLSSTEVCGVCHCWRRGLMRWTTHGSVLAWSLLHSIFCSAQGWESWSVLGFHICQAKSCTVHV